MLSWVAGGKHWEILKSRKRNRRSGFEFIKDDSVYSVGKWENQKSVRRLVWYRQERMLGPGRILRDREKGKSFRRWVKDTGNLEKNSGFWLDQLCWIVSHFAERNNVTNRDRNNILNFVLAVYLKYCFLNFMCIGVSPVSMFMCHPCPAPIPTSICMSEAYRSQNQDLLGKDPRTREKLHVGAGNWTCVL